MRFNLTLDAHYAINEDGSEYDDDVGGPAHGAGRDGIDLEPLRPEQDATARLAAQKLFDQIERKARSGYWLWNSAVGLCTGGHHRLPVLQSNRLIRSRVTLGSVWG